MTKLLLSFDFEDWHQLVHRRLGRADWDSQGEALERQTEAIFALLDELEARATFFVLGMTAERYPDLIREIAGRGHGSPATATRTSGFTRRRRMNSAATSSAAPRSSSNSVGGGRSATARRPSRSHATRPGPTRPSPSSASATTRASTTRRGSHAGSGPCRRRPTGWSCLRAARSGSFRSRSGTSGAGRCPSAAARTGACCRLRCCGARYGR